MYPEKLDPAPAHSNQVQSNKDSSVDDVAIDPEAERKLVRKLDIFLLPLFGLAYCTNFIDRTSVGNAKIAGIEKDLGMLGFDYNIALTVFYIFFIAVDIPSNLALKRFGSPWLAALITLFGVISISTAFVKSYAGFIVNRVFLGLAEGGTLSGLTYLLSRFYRRQELVFRIGVFFGASTPIAGAFGGLLASGLLSVPDIGSVKSWRKIFLIEGIITTGFGLLCFLILPNDPRDTRLLNAKERTLAVARIDAGQTVRTRGHREKTTLKLIIRSLSFPTVLLTICYIMLNISFQGLSLFMPTVVSTLGHFTVVESQLRTVPPYIVATVWSVTISYFSYRIRQRTVVMLFCAFLMIVAYSISIGTRNSQARYGACFLSLAGASPGGPLVLSWATDNASPDTVKAVATAMVPGVGALGSVIAVWTYLPTDAPDYHDGNSLNLSTSCAIFVLVTLCYVYLRFENAKRDRGERDYRLQGKSQREIEELGYLHPEFRYQT